MVTTWFAGVLPLLGSLMGPPPAQDGVHGFEAFSDGPFTTLTAGGLTVTAPEGHAEIDPAHRRSGEKCLHLFGGEHSEVVLELDEAVDAHRVSFWAERWTRNDPFSLFVDARVRGRWREVHDASEEVRVGGFLVEVIVPLAGERVDALRLRCSSPPGKGVLVDDVCIAPVAPMRIERVEATMVGAPLLLGEHWSPLLRIDVRTSGNQGPLELTGLDFVLRGSEHLAAVDVFASSSASPPGWPYSLDAGREGLHGIGECRPGPPADGLVPFTVRGQAVLVEGENPLFVVVRPKEDADLSALVGAAATRVRLGEQHIAVVGSGGPGSPRLARMGLPLRRAGDDGVAVYRIPGLATSNEGTLLAVYDIRHGGWRDLPGHIDVGLSRSTDRGTTWERMRTVVDMGEPHGENGVGDPAILVDRVTGRIWIAALWSHGDRGWNGSGPGLSPEQTGQLVLVHSDDDGRTWSEPRNITAEVKDPAWRLLLQGPGKGITMRDGTLVFPAQFRDGSGLPHSTILWSRDRGATWSIGTGARPDTTEAQVVELDDGTLMLNMRDNRGGSRSVHVTDDLGTTWTAHPSSRGALSEPVCMASLIRVEGAGDRPTLLLFSNPAVPEPPRRNLTIRASLDQGATWPGAWHTPIHLPGSAGYSCMTRIDDGTIGILYEGGGDAHLIFQRFALDELLRP